MPERSCGMVTAKRCLEAPLLLCAFRIKYINQKTAKFILENY